MIKDETIYSSEYIKIIRRGSDFYIESYKKGMSVAQFNDFISRYSNIKITSFIVIKNAILFAPRPLEKFGEIKERIAIEISSDELKAYIKLSVSDDELEGDAKLRLVKEIMKKLKDEGIIFGVKSDILVSNLCNNKQILVAEGIAPEKGVDSVIKMYEIKEAKPEVKEDGKVDHYELSLINRVQAGEWLGERKDPTLGIPGRTVKGMIIQAANGKMYPLEYDKGSVREEHKNGVTTLYALRSGAVQYDGDKISVSNHLEIDGDVDFKVGNIDFDGYLTVQGTIEDNFTVKATKDIEILGEYGIGSVREVISIDGSINIIGGIAGKNKAVIKSKRDIYTKFVSDATIICEGSVHIGFYCRNSNIKAKEVIFDSSKSQIIGGNIQAEVKVVASSIGSENENKTVISVIGFNREEYKEKLENLISEIELLKNELIKVRQDIIILSNKTNLVDEQRERYKWAKSEFLSIADKLKGLERERKLIVSALRTKGEGEITITKKAYPGVILEIKNITEKISSEINNVCFYLKDGKIEQL
ncbi:MAG: DUF342 domain-containing protein [Clostridiaceae bacterium]|nr:DUF342 domain-containing protein [Clostridiaceae bacterium]